MAETTYIEDIAKHEGQPVRLRGWLERKDRHRLMCLEWTRARAGGQLYEAAATPGVGRSSSSGQGGQGEKRQE